jgi:hypothetical protein
MLVERGGLAVDGDPVAWVEDMVRTLPRGRLQSPTRLPSRAGESNSSTRIRPSRFLAATAAVYQLTLVTGDERLLHAKGFAVMRG